MLNFSYVSAMLPTLVVPFGFNCEEASALDWFMLDALPPVLAPKSMAPARPSPAFKVELSGVKLKPKALVSVPSLEERCPVLVSLLNSDCKASMAEPVSSEPVMFKTDKVLGLEVAAPAWLSALSVEEKFTDPDLSVAPLCIMSSFKSPKFALVVPVSVLALTKLALKVPDKGLSKVASVAPGRAVPVRAAAASKAGSMEGV